MKKIPVNPFSNATGTTVAGLAEDGASVAVSASKLAAGGSTTGWNFVCTLSTDGDYGLFQAADPCANSVDGTFHVDY